MPKHLYVSEIFGPTFQGEGPSLGRRCFFVRLFGCNLTCKWCDTAYTWNPAVWAVEGKQVERMQVHEVVERLVELGYDEDLLIISGGEPMLQQEGIEGLIFDLPYRGWPEIEIETNGTVSPTVRGLTQNPKVRFNVSPKLAHSGCPSEIAYGFQGQFLTRSTFKFVVQRPSDLDEVARFELPPEKVWIMPEGTSSHVVDNTIRFIAQEVLDRGWNLTTRLQVLLWGAERGR